MGRPPMTVLRDLRMRQAADQLTSGALTLDHIAGHAGYDSRSSFVRAFRKAYGNDPTEYRDRLSQRPGHCAALDGGTPATDSQTQGRA
jgi:AraC-like DNA-binding protein